MGNSPSKTYEERERKLLKARYKSGKGSRPASRSASVSSKLGLGGQSKTALFSENIEPLLRNVSPKSPNYPSVLFPDEERIEDEGACCRTPICTVPGLKPPHQKSVMSLSCGTQVDPDYLTPRIRDHNDSTPSLNVQVESSTFSQRAKFLDEYFKNERDQANLSPKRSDMSHGEEPGTDKQLYEVTNKIEEVLNPSKVFDTTSATSLLKDAGTNTQRLEGDMASITSHDSDIGTLVNAVGYIQKKLGRFENQLKKTENLNYNDGFRLKVHLNVVANSVNNTLLQLADVEEVDENVPVDT